jgi:hypothetical protein
VQFLAEVHVRNPYMKSIDAIKMVIDITADLDFRIFSDYVLVGEVTDLSA